MKKQFLISSLILLIIAASCTKWDDEAFENPATNTGELVFMGKSNQLKNLNTIDLKAEYALLTINGIEYNPLIYYINDVPYTQSIKLAPGSYTVEQFLLFDDNQTPNLMTDDSLIFAIPAAGSDYAMYVHQTTPFDIEVQAFMKAEYAVEVLHFEPAEYEEFGFDWFAIEQSIIHEQCFFGDLCVENPEDYATSLYEEQVNGLQVDMPAIAKIELWQNSEKFPNSGFVLQNTFDNSGWYGEGEPLCVKYQDYLMYEDQYELKLYVLLAVDDSFEYVRIHTWEISDDELPETGEDGIVDYVIGNCAPDADYIFPPYTNPGGGSGAGPETAYAYSDGIDVPGDCFNNLGIGNNWGWQLGPFDTDYTFDLYAAAGQCNINNGVHVGELVVDFKNKNFLKVTYNMLPDFRLEEVHLWYDEAPWQGNNVAPGQFPYKEDELAGVSTYTFNNLPYNNTAIYLIAHAVVTENP